MGKRPSDFDLDQAMAHAGWLRRLALHLVGPDRAEDLVQDAWVVALESPPRRAGVLTAWLAQVLRTRGANLVRSEARRRRREQSATSGQTVSPPDEAAAILECQKQVFRAVSSLREPFRTVVVLRFYENLSTAQIADRLGVPPSTVRNRLAKGLRVLREDLERRHGTDWRAATLAALAPPGIGAIPSAVSLPLEIVAMSLKAKLALGLGGLVLLAAAFIWPTLTGADADGERRSGPVAVAATPDPTSAGSATSPAPTGEPDPLASRSLLTLPGVPVRDGRLRVVDEAGTPIPNARATGYVPRSSAADLARQGRSISSSELEPTVVEEANEVGVLLLTGIPSKAAVALYVEKAGFATRVMVIEPGSDEGDANAGDFILERGRFLALQLLDENGSPISAAEVSTLGYPSQLTGTLTHQSLVTDEHGIVEFRGLSNCTTGFYTAPPGFIPHHEADVALSDVPLAPRQIVLQRGSSIALTVVDQAGSPVEGAEVYLEEGDFYTPLVTLHPRADGFQGCTDSNGRFVVQGLMAEWGSYGLAVRKGTARVASGATRPGSCLTVQLPSCAQVQGRILDQEGQPAAGGVLVMVNASDPTFPPDLQTTLDSEGRFTAVLPAGRYRLACWHAGGGLIHPDSILVAGDLALPDVRLAPRATLLLHVVDGSGQALEDYQVHYPLPRGSGERAMRQQSEAVLEALLIYSSNGFFRPRAEANPLEERGTRKILHLPEGNYPLQIAAAGHHPELVQVDLRAGRTVERVVQLDATAELRIQTVDSIGQPVRGLNLEIYPDGYDFDWYRKRSLAAELAPPRLRALHDVTDAQGVVSFGSIAVGTWHVNRWNRSGVSPPWATIDVGPGANVCQVFIPELIDPVFVLEDANGPVDGANIRLQQALSVGPSPDRGQAGFESGGFSGVTDRTGTCRLASLEPADYRVQILPQGAFPLQEEVRIDVSSFAFRFRLEGETISGTVEACPASTQVVLARFRGEPVGTEESRERLQSMFWTGSADHFLPVGGHVEFSYVVPREDGGFRFTSVPPGSYFILARAESYLVSEPQRIDVEGESISDLRIRMERAGEVVLRVSGLAGFWRQWPGVRIEACVLNGNGCLTLLHEPFPVEEGDLPFSPVEPGEAVIVLRFFDGPTEIPSVRLPVLVQSGQTSVVSWDASSAGG